MGQPRVAIFPCTYKEVDGVANTMRHFVAYAKQQHLPVLNVHAGFAHEQEEDGSIRRLEFPRRWPKFRLDTKLYFDVNFWRYRGEVERAVREFRPDLIHITGPSDVGQLGALIAHRLRVPLVASWHTNVHEYAQQRLMPLIGFIPRSARDKVGEKTCDFSLRVAGRFYRFAQVLFAPNQELMSLLEQMTGKHCHLMSRGVNTELFKPERRTRNDDRFVIGFVGRLSTEKNIRLFAELESALVARGCSNFRIHIVGRGADAPWLRENLHHADLLGLKQGEELAEAYANFDVFAFPSTSDTFGNVVLEAMAAGVPAVVTSGGGPKFIVQHDVSGLVAVSNVEFVAHVAALLKNRELCRQMAQAARKRALQFTWDAVFRHVYQVYDAELARLHRNGNNRAA